MLGGDNNIFTQIGLIVLVGLASKNGILIVKFARELKFQGRSVIEAAVEASRLRLRPILMTSIAFIAGVIPLVIASGTGAEMRHAMGIAVLFGMLGVTFFGLVMTPVFYAMLRALTGNRPLTHYEVGSLEVESPSLSPDRVQALDHQH
jgi:multidrug efflux pump